MNPIFVSDISKFVQGLNENDELVFDSQVPSERNYMEIQQTESYTWYDVYTKPLFAYEAYFRIRVSLLVDKYRKKFFQFGIMAVPLKTTSIDLQVNLHVSTWGKTIGQETLNITNHDGTSYETRSYDFFRCEQFKIVLGDIQINEYDEKEYETMNFKIASPSENNYKESGIVSGDFKWYRNSSPNINLKGRRSDDSIQTFFDSVKKLSLKYQCFKLDLIRLFNYRG